LKNFKFSKEINTTDLIKTVVGIIGAIIAFFLITNIQLQNESTRLKLELTKQIPKLQPFVQTNFTNRVDPENPNKIDIKLYLKILSEHYLYFFPPKIHLIKKDTKCTYYPIQPDLVGVDAYNGFFSPGTAYNINYSIIVDDPSILDQYDVYLTFDIETDEKIQAAYLKVLTGLDGDVKKLIDSISYKTHSYREKVHFKNKNFKPFFNNKHAR